ncbi:MAG: response regulator [Flavobacterium sp.]|nr:response regulator [Pedobacter sp.]
MKKLGFLIFLLFLIHDTNAQFVFKYNSLPEKISLIPFAYIADAGYQDLNIKQVKNNKTNLKFLAQKGLNANLGFTDHTYWLKFQLHNQTLLPVFYYLEAAEPITDNVNFYLFDENDSLETQQSGDKIPFNQKSVAFRKTTFIIQLQPGQRKEAFLEVKNDGEKNNLPLNLISQQSFLKTTYNDQLFMGVFYGILFIIAITYLFFYFALNERIFLYYTLYVTFVGLCQFALDGFFHQYVDQSTSWINQHAVIITAIAGSYFFGKYSELVLEVQEKLKNVSVAFKVIYVLLGLKLASIVLFPAYLAYAYPIVNVLTLVGMVLILIAVITLFVRRESVDLFYTFGIAILFICFTLAILLNFGLISGFSVENITKPGIGLEIIMLSLSMANRIRILKSRKEELQAIALQKSEEMNEVKSNFLSNMSHELRTPLNAILGLSNTMEGEATDPKSKANFEEIKTAAFSLISSVNDIMDFSKIEKGEIRLDSVPFSPSGILDKVHLYFDKKAQAKGLKFNFTSNISPLTIAIGDPGRLEQIVNNVLSNSVKFTASGFVNVNVTSAEAGNKLNLLITISDSGIGISKAKLNSVFDMFSQVDISRKRKFGGFGIGLCVVKALVNLHGGTVKLTSKENEGTTCVISLDYLLAEKESKPTSLFPDDSYDLLGKHVLIVEDNPMNQMVLKMMMKKWQNTTLTFSNNGAESIEALKNNQIDVILMDLQMPVMDGYEATTAIRNGDAGESNNRVPIIVVTADVMETTRDLVFNLGADDYMNKPVDQKMLYEKIKALLSQQKETLKVVTNEVRGYPDISAL